MQQLEYLHHENIFVNKFENTVEPFYIYIKATQDASLSKEACHEG